MMKASLKFAEAAVLMGVLLGLSFALGCSPPGGGSNDGSSVVTEPTPTPTPTPDPTTLSPLTLEVATSWDGTPAPNFEVHKLCEVEPNASRGSTTNCSLNIEEGRLFHSSVKFTWGTQLPARCPIVRFIPYFYVRSTDGGYLPPGMETPPDCAKARFLRDPKCFGGAGVYLVDGFPKNLSFTSINFGATSFSKTIASEFKLRHYHGAPVNYLITNDLSLNKANPIVGEPRTYDGADQWEDYRVICEDEWGYPWHTLIVTISDEDYDGSESHVEDNYPDWN